MNRIRRALLECWAMLLTAAVVGFLGPFGSYLDGDFIARATRWSQMLMGAYVMIRPVMLLCGWLERITRLPRGFVVLWGTIVSAFPMALVWLMSSPHETRQLGGYAGLLPFSLLCAMLVLVVVWWAERADARLRELSAMGLPGFRHDDDDAPIPGLVMPAAGMDASSPMAIAVATVGPGAGQGAGHGPRLRARLSRGFSGPVLALESEDHYVRVHGEHGSELLLLRLRDAIVEMDDCPGEQTHRSWWVARGSVAQVDSSGRSRQLRLTNGLRVPVARDSVSRLQHSGFLPL